MLPRINPRKNLTEEGVVDGVLLERGQIVGIYLEEGSEHPGDIVFASPLVGIGNHITSPDSAAGQSRREGVGMTAVTTNHVLVCWRTPEPSHCEEGRGRGMRFRLPPVKGQSSRVWEPAAVYGDSGHMRTNCHQSKAASPRR